MKIVRDVEVLWVSRFDYEPQWRLRPHAHPFFQMIYIRQGKGSFIMDHVTYPLLPDTLFFIHPKQSHSLVPDPSGPVQTLDRKFAIHSQELKTACMGVDSVLHEVSAEIANNIEQIREEGVTRQPLYNEFTRLYLLDILLSLLRHSRTPLVPVMVRPSLFEVSTRDPICANAQQFMHAHYQEQCTAEDLAAFLNISYRYLSKKFLRVLGIPPMKYLALYRIERAKDLLRFTEFEIKQIASNLGFQSVHYFSRQFSAITGIPPGVWRQKEREGIGKDIVLTPSFINEDYVERPQK
ncbi:MAG TPA: AraC family transcriptional regulator [Armatimonadota bacterium]